MVKSDGQCTARKLWLEEQFVVGREGKMRKGKSTISHDLVATVIYISRMYF